MTDQRVAEGPLGPLVGELDLHLFNEGRHRRLYDWLGAHVTTLDGADGTAFSSGPLRREKCDWSGTSTDGTAAST